MFETFDHTADLGLRARAADRDTLFAEIGHGLVATFVEWPERIAAEQTRTFTLTGDDPAYLLFDWLAELLRLFSSEEFLPARIRACVGDAGLTATLDGEMFDPERHGLGHEVKAITYHGLRFEPDADGWLAEAIVDI